MSKPHVALSQRPGLLRLGISCIGRSGCTGHLPSMRSFTPGHPPRAHWKSCESLSRVGLFRVPTNGQTKKFADWRCLHAEPVSVPIAQKRVFRGHHRFRGNRDHLGWFGVAGSAPHHDFGLLCQASGGESLTCSEWTCRKVSGVVFWSRCPRKVMESLHN